MKRYIGWIIGMVLLAVTAQAADFQQAEESYRQGHFATALNEYEQLLHIYPNDPNLYYNIGNCYFKMDSIGLATANYYRAFQLNPRDADIRHNLALALQHSGERLVPAGMPEILHQAFFGLTALELKGLFYLSFWLFCMVAGVWLIKRRYGKIAFGSFVFLLLITSWYAWRYQIDHTPLAVVAAPVAELRSGPGENFPASANVAQGHLLLLQDKKDHWQQVIVKSQGIKGWMNASNVEEL